MNLFHLEKPLHVHSGRIGLRPDQIEPRQSRVKVVSDNGDYVTVELIEPLDFKAGETLWLSDQVAAAYLQSAT